ncbi:N-acetylmuramidase family protein [Paraburkholderia sp. RP-4-7]|jgi:hypothetical protein|uniref:N-acetylmuramidase family protein n=1 Tax=Paraburkholderia polaris TaxID=2728848 RepID=A0A848IPU2_9BURK|nr:N-acetylmuramidase family protein [Paraburkholderia polaris]NMM01875.1 N-acetylmuramidase family protein [Paraburkholderia polaris]
MSPTCENFIRAVLTQSWRDAYLNLNGLNMDEMLRAQAALDPLDLADMWAQRQAFTGQVDMPRIEYAHDVVTTRKIPQTAPGDLGTTGQTNDAKSFIGKPKPLTFEHDLTGTLPATSAAPARLGEHDFVLAAKQNNVEVAAIMAVAQVESGGRSGFAADSRPVIRYELHLFDRHTGKAYRKTHPHLSQPDLASGERYHHGGQPNEWSLVFGAMILRDSKGGRRISEAWQSTSWGMFQVLGSNSRMVGWPTVGAFVADMFVSEAQHLRAFLGYCKATHLFSQIRTHHWAAFANGYNGPTYAVNRYDSNLANAFASISSRRRGSRLPP